MAGKAGKSSKSAKPLKNGGNGRDSGGKFTKGNKAAVGRGAPRNEARAALREAFASDATPERLLALAASIRRMAMDGDMQAAKIYLDRVIGPVLQDVESGQSVTVTFNRPEIDPDVKSDEFVTSKSGGGE